MRVLHTALMTSFEPGVLNQMSSERIAAKRAGIEWDCLLAMPYAGNEMPDFVQAIPEKAGSRPARLFSNIKQRFLYYKKILKIRNEYDVFLIRYRVSEPLFFIFLLFLRRAVYTVHHTLELPEILHNESWKNKIKYILEKVIGKINLRMISGAVCVTDEISVHQRERANCPNLKVYTYPNGIFLNNVETHIHDDRHPSTPEFLFMASNFVPWHGLDLLLKDVAHSDKNFTLHLVGNVDVKQFEKFGNDKRIVFHGVKSGKELDDVISRSWVGLSSFALYRKGMEEACTLKVREYLLHGIPVYSGHRDVFPSDFPYYQEGPVSICEMYTFAKLMRSVSRSTVRAQSFPLISKEVLLIKLFKEIERDNLF